MKKHIKIYHDALGIPLSDDCKAERISELGGGVGTDLHHIERRGMGGSKSLDRIENIIALTNSQHRKYGDKKQYKRMLFVAHRDFLISRGVEFDVEWLNEQINKN